MENDKNWLIECTRICSDFSLNLRIMAKAQNLTKIIIDIFLVRQAFRPKTPIQEKTEDDNAQAKEIKVEADIENKGSTSLYIILVNKFTYVELNIVYHLIL